MPHELIFVSPMLGTTDYITAEGSDTIKSITSRLLWKYSEEVVDLLSTTYQNVRINPTINLVTVKVYRIDRGRKKPVGLRETIDDIIEMKTNKLYWIPEPIGGR
jgi:hypothetical protein